MTRGQRVPCAVALGRVGPDHARPERARTGQKVHEQRAPEAPTPRLGAYVQIERDAGVLAEGEVAPHGTHGVRPLARAGGEALDDTECGRLVQEVCGSERQQAPVVVVPGLAPGGEIGIPDFVDGLHRQATLDGIACRLRRVRTRIFVALAASLCLAASVQAAGQQESVRTGASASFRLVAVAKGLSSPVYVTAAPGDKRLFVVEQGGTIRTVRHGKVAAKPYADLRGFVTAGGEQGLLSVAFSPGFAANGKLY